VKNDKIIKISTANSRTDKKWKREELYWSEFVKRLETPHKSPEKIDEYLSYPKSKQDKLKDVGGYVGGLLKNDTRKANNVISRDLVTLDLDNIKAGKTPEVLKTLKALVCTYAAHSTRKHVPHAPRLRVIFPLSRSVTAEEYEPIARKLAEIIGMEMCDKTTFQPNRLMYEPSISSDSEYVFDYVDESFLDVDKILGMYKDWKNIQEWPGIENHKVKLPKKQEDPTLKNGVIGAFCREFDIIKAIDEYLAGAYEFTDVSDRLTYMGGSTYGGAILYEDGKFLYSHHATDPASGKLCSSFDLVRLHMFSDLDDDIKDNTPMNRYPSFKAMSELALENSKIKIEVQKERLSSAEAVFKNDIVIDAEIVNDDWMALLDTNSDGKILSNTKNILIILENEPELKGKLAYDRFSNRAFALGKLPWSNIDKVRDWEDGDDARLRVRLDVKYGILGKTKIDDALTEVFLKNSYNEPKEFLEGLIWDGVERLNTLLIDYLGAEDNIYTRETIRKSLIACCARAIKDEPVKFDEMIILNGPQGIGKSTFLSKLGMKWFSDSLKSFDGKEAAEIIQGTWLNEIGELDSFNRSEITTIKHFLSKSTDIYREAYGRRTKKFPRRAVFFGTSNDTEFLKDTTGNRRFWPIDVGRQGVKKRIFGDLEGELEQIWAEAMEAFDSGEGLLLSKEAEEIAKQEQENHRIRDHREGIIQEFLEIKIPADWDTLTDDEKRNFYKGRLPNAGKVCKREKICIPEIWEFCLESDLRNLKKSDAIALNKILEMIHDWERMRTPLKFGKYGSQRGFKRKKH
jgi:hypothetical protein